ncbi:hypothetical protein ACA910_002902 [Epithemia clementina (nom. ined.)]
MSGIPTIDGTIPSLQPDHWITTTITTFRQWLITFHRGLTNSTPVDISRSLSATHRISNPTPRISPATQRISHLVPRISPATQRISYPTSRVFHPTQSMLIIPAPIHVDVFPTSLSHDGGEVSHTTGYADFPSINKSCDPSNTDTVDKSTQIDVDEAPKVSPHTSHQDTCHFKTQDSIRSEYFDAYQQLQHIIANKHCNPDFTFMFDNIADNKNAASYNNENAAQLWGDSSYIETNAKKITLQTIADDDPTNDSSYYGETIDTDPIIIGNNLWGVTTTPTSILGETYHQEHDYEETITIGNNLWGEINLNLLSGSILIGNKLWGENLSFLTCTTTM